MAPWKKLTYVLSLLFAVSLSITNGQTEEGNSDGLPCVFPFKYQGNEYVHCIDINAERPWCATTADYDLDSRWGYCKAEDMRNLPSFNEGTPTNVTLYQGENARLMCIVNNLQNKKVTWQRKGYDYPLTIARFAFIADGRYQIEHDEPSEWNLLINKLQRSDTGIYQCRVTTRTRQLVREIHLTVQDLPPQPTPVVTIGEQAKMYIEKGQPLILQCNATAKNSPAEGDRILPPEIEWFRDGYPAGRPDSPFQAIVTNQIRGRLRISTLEIEKTVMSSGGSYVCRTTDKTNAEVQVTVFNVDRENVKRGTVGGSDALQANGNGKNSSWTTCSSLLILVLTTVTTFYLT